MISIDLFGAPIAAKRPKFTMRGKFPHAFDAQKKLKETYRWQIRSQYLEEPLKMPVYVDVVFYMPIAQSLSGIKKRQMANGVIAHTTKPDVDNLLKLVLDCLNDLVIEDDSQIVELRGKKIYSNKPGTLIRIIPLADEKRELLYENISR